MRKNAPRAQRCFIRQHSCILRSRISTNCPSLSRRHLGQLLSPPPLPQGAACTFKFSVGAIASPDPPPIGRRPPPVRHYCRRSILSRTPLPAPIPPPSPHLSSPPTHTQDPFSCTARSTLQRARGPTSIGFFVTVCFMLSHCCVSLLEGFLGVMDFFNHFFNPSLSL